MEIINRINGRTHLLTLIGSPIEHSASPAIHTLSLRQLGMNVVYLAFDVRSDDLSTVMDAMRAMKGWDGSNVTMPCKQAIIPYLDELSIAAKLIGAVNVVRKEADGRITGHNADGVGFMNNLRKHGVNATHARMSLIGPGGAGSAILAQAALDGVDRIDVFARAGGKSHAHAQSLIARIRERTACAITLHDIADEDTLRNSIASSTILVNASSIGMGERCTDLPVPADALHADLAVADIVYLPRESQLIREAASRGCPTMPGLGMLLEQAAESERIWYDVEMPTAAIATQLFA